MEKVKRRDHDIAEKEGFNFVLDWILCNKQQFYRADTEITGFHNLPVDFVTYRGIITLLMCTPYETKESWIIHAIRFRNTIYLRRIETPMEKERRLKQDEQDMRMCSWGYKFEQHMTCKDTSAPVYEAEEYCAALKAKLGAHSLLYVAEADCVDDKIYESAKFDDVAKAFVELKTSKLIRTQWDSVSFFRHKLKKWWAQSYLSATPRVLCGFRDSEGIVRKLQWYQVEDMPNMASDYWRKSVMLTFTNDVLEWIKKTVVLESKTREKSVVYKFESKPSERKVTCSVFPAGTGMGFMPDYYFNNVFKS